MRRNLMYLFIFGLTQIMISQIGISTSYPTLKPSHILDEKLENISFALSFRVLESNYNGPLVRLRRASDNAELDFCAASNDIVDIGAINTWRSGVDTYVVIWYDQSGQGNDAVQNNANQQPLFAPDMVLPHFQGDGNNDYLIIDTPNGVQDVTNNGNEGSVLAIMRSQQRDHHSFGVLTDSDRWSSHANWGSNRFFFDPGICCVPDDDRSFVNSDFVNVFSHYTMIKGTTTSLVRRQGMEMYNTGAASLGSCTRTEDFGIGWATGNQTGNFSNTAFVEFIMYKTDVSSSHYEKIEQNSMIFWGL